MRASMKKESGPRFQSRSPLHARLTWNLMGIRPVQTHVRTVPVPSKAGTFSERGLSLPPAGAVSLTGHSGNGHFLLQWQNDWLGSRYTRQTYRSGIPCLYITGTYADQWALRGVANSALLSKPFASPQLVTAVSQLLMTM
jgi:hypothetical protein